MAIVVVCYFCLFKRNFWIICSQSHEGIDWLQREDTISCRDHRYLAGNFFLFNIGAGVVALPFVFAVWFIADSVFALLAADLAKGVSNGYYWFTVIVNILGIILGIMLLFNPISSALTLSFLVGFYFMLFGITHIVYAFR